MRSRAQTSLGFSEVLSFLSPGDLHSLSRHVDTLEENGWVSAEAARRWQEAITRAQRRGEARTGSDPEGSHLQ